MIHSPLNLTRRLIIPDTETTGTDVKNDRIIELAFQIWTPEGLQKEYRTLVNPLVPILNSVTGKHGITDADMKLCQRCKQDEGWHGDPGGPDSCSFKRVPTFKQLAANLANGFKNCDYAGKNVRFDLQILAAEFARNDVVWTIGDARIVDADRLEALLNKRSLSHLYRKYTGKKLEGAHGALTDVRATAAVIDHQMESFTQNEDEAVPLPRDLDELHSLQFPGMIDLDGKFQFIDGIACFTRWGKYAGKPMMTADVSYWDWILKNNFTAEVKSIAANAKLGKFPEVRR